MSSSPQKNKRKAEELSEPKLVFVMVEEEGTKDIITRKIKQLKNEKLFYVNYVDLVLKDTSDILHSSQIQF